MPHNGAWEYCARNSQYQKSTAQKRNLKQIQKDEQQQHNEPGSWYGI
jgi:hypothetical protein